MRRKLLSLILTLAMVLALVPVSTLTVKAEDVTYEKVTAVSDLTDGQYLIVYESESVAFDGSLSALDVANDYVSVVISSENSIVLTEETDPSFTITAVAGGYTIQSASGFYIGRTANSNGLNTSQSPDYVNTITFDNGDVVIMANAGPTLRFNSASDQKRFRYYKSGQKAIQLYKLQTGGAGSECTHNWVVDLGSAEGDQHTETCSICNTTRTVSCSFEHDGNAGVDGHHTVVCECNNSKSTECSFGTVVFQEGNAPTCATAGSGTEICTVCGYSHVVSVEATGRHVDADGDENCDTCNESMTSISRDALDVLLGLTDSNPTVQKYTMVGTVTEVVTEYNSSFKNATVDITLSDAAGTDHVVRCYRLTSVNHLTELEAIKVGDIITVYGNLQYYDQTTREFTAGCELTALKQGEGQEQETAPALTVGDYVALICDSKSVELSSISTTNTHYGLTKGFTGAPAGLMPLEVVDGYSEGSFAFKNGDRYLYWTSGNSLDLNDTLTENSSWIVEIDDNGNATIKNAQDEERRICYNASANRFACYNQNYSNYPSVQLFVLPRIVGRNVTLDENLTLGLYVSVDQERYESTHLVVTLNGETKDLSVPETAESDGRYKLSYSDILPAQMNNTIHVELQKADGSVLDTKDFSLKEYFLELKSKSSIDGYSAAKKAALDTLIDDLLAYGAAAQIKFASQVEDGAEFTATGSDRMPAASDNVFSMTPTIGSQADANAAVGFFKNATVIHENVNWIRILYKGVMDGVTCTIDYGTGTEEAIEFYPETAYLCTKGIKAGEYGTTITVRAKKDGTTISTLIYSVNSYCYRKSADDFVKALYNYGVSAKLFRDAD